MRYEIYRYSSEELPDLPFMNPARRVIHRAGLTEEQIKELVSDDISLHTSGADCVKACARRLLQAKERGEKVFIGGDYDADGICSTAIMKDLLDRLGIENGYYIPDRFKEGYGLNPATVERVFQKGYQLILTVDNGVKAIPAILKAGELGMEIIVTDHHRIEEEIPADLVVHPDYMEEAFSVLSGAGVALEISRSLIGDCPLHTALAGIAAIGDVMPLWKENRRIIKNALHILRAGRVPAVSALVRSVETLTPTDIAFQVVPKLNSVGRMNDRSNVNTLVPYLLMNNPSTVRQFADQLNQINGLRKTLSGKMSDSAEALIHPEEKIIVLFREDFHEGLNGLVAGKLANAHRKPVLVFSKSNNLIKGSGRSIPGFDLFQFFSEGFAEMTAFGGHSQAVGLALKEADFPSFREKVNRKADQSDIRYEEPVLPVLELPAEELCVASVEDLKRLEPYPKELGDFFFGLSRPELREIYNGPKVRKFELMQTREKAEVILFPSSGIEIPDQIGMMIGKPQVNEWKSNKTCQFVIDSFKEVL